MHYFFLALIFLFGSALGSFLAVIANRYNTGLPFFKGRSFCFSCNTQLQKKDLIPLFSFLSLKGRCRYCQSKIPKEIFIIEVLMGALIMLVAFKLGIFGSNFQFSIFNFQLIFNFLILISIFGTILLISIYDLKHFIIPNSFLLVLFFLSSLLFFDFSAPLSSKLLALSSLNLFYGVILTLPFLLLFLISRGKWLGFGDVKYILVLGFWLGIVQGLSAVILAFWIGAVFSLIAISVNRLKIRLPIFGNNLTIKSEIPFGPFLSVGAIISFCLNLDLFHLNELFNLF